MREVLRIPAVFASRFSDPVMLLHTELLDHVSSILNLAALRIERKGVDLEEMNAEQASGDFWNPESPFVSRLRPYNVKNGVLEIPVKGALLAEFPYQFGAWATGYEYIRQAVMRGAEDANVRSIAFMVDSPGGHAAECFEASKFIRATLAKSKKPSASYCALACSGAFAIAICADKVLATDSAEVGAVGVIVTHFEYSEALAQAGVKPTIITAGKGKGDGNSLTPLSEDAKARMQERANFFYGKFTKHVATSRDLSVDAVVKAGAYTYYSQDALDVGYADQIVETLSVGYEDVGIAGTDEDEDEDGDTTMSKTETSTFTQADIDNARAEGASAERQRLSEIMSLPEAAGREKVAMNFATKTDMAPAAVADMLKDVPAVATQPAPAAEVKGKDGKVEDDKKFDEAMSKTQNPEVKPGAAKPDERTQRLAGPRAAIAALAKHKGAAPTKK